MQWLSSLGPMLPLGIAVIVVAALSRFMPRAPRHRLRRSVILYAVYLALIALESIAKQVQAPNVVVTALHAGAGLCELFLIINLAALVLFDWLLAATRLKISDILHDLTVGAAYLVAMIWSMHGWGVNLTGIVATSAVATAVIGLSLQPTLGSVIGGLALQLDDSLREGDWIELENKTQGQVKKVRWRHTVIETRDFDTLIVPNNQLLSQTLRVLGKREGWPVQHRVWVRFNVDHRYAPGEVIQRIEDALRSAPIAGAATEPAPDAICLDLARENGDSYCHYAVRYYLKDLARDDPTSSVVRERIYAALRRAQIPLALPAAALFITQEDAKTEKRLAKVQGHVHSALRGVELFARLSEDELAILSDSAKLAPFVEGETITRQGAQANWLYILVRGEVEVRVAGEDGRERRVAVLKSPGFFGEMALMTGAPREATVVALSDVDCLRIDKDDFREVLARRPEIAENVSEVLAKRRVELESVRDNLDAESKRRRAETEGGHILASIRDFFGLDPESKRH